ncbi:MAG: hypothetical protein IIB72_06975 [Proteobacteria bacterium]|nr:hypothetical protein [Pseudomonadota bacterium]
MFGKDACAEAFVGREDHQIDGRGRCRESIPFFLKTRTKSDIHTGAEPRNIGGARNCGIGRLGLYFADPRIYAFGFDLKKTGTLSLKLEQLTKAQLILLIENSTREPIESLKKMTPEDLMKIMEAHRG